METIAGWAAADMMGGTGGYAVWESKIKTKIIVHTDLWKLRKSDTAMHLQ